MPGAMCSAPMTTLTLLTGAFGLTVKNFTSVPSMVSNPAEEEVPVPAASTEYQ